MAGLSRRVSCSALALLAATALGGSPAPAGAQPAKSAPRVDPAKILLRGAGATFPAPLYKKWINEYGKVDPNVVIDYKDVGSGEGVKRFLEQGVEFGASDSALNDEQFARAKGNAVLVPTTAGMVVLAYNIPGLNRPLRLSRAVYLDILAGKITRWNDPRLQAINSGLKLPNRTIAIVARLDSSGTTYALSNHLNAIGPKWREYGGTVGNMVDWPGKAMLAKGNEGVAGIIKQAQDSIGYVEYGFAKRLGLPMAHLENKAGRYVEPNAESGRAALAANLKDVSDDLRIFLPDPAGEDSYPIVSLTWFVLYGRYPDAAKGAALKRFVTWSLTQGQSHGAQMGYVPLPDDLLERSRVAAGAIQ